MTIVNILGESAVRSLVLALIVAAGLRLLRVRHVRIAKRAWTMVLVLALAMPALVAWHVPSFSLAALWVAPPQPIPSAPPAGAGHSEEPVFLRAPSRHLEVASSASLAAPTRMSFPVSAAPSHSIAWSYIGFIAYLSISTLMLLRIFTGLLLGARIWRRAQTFTTTVTDLPVRLTVELRSPVTFANGILLPLEAITWDDASLRATLAHEETHVREGDFYWQLAASLHLCFFWISPFAWWLRPQLARLSEIICDRAAVASTGDGLSYAQLLLRFATVQQTPAGMVAMAQSAGLRERVERLIADPQLGSAFRRSRGQAVGAALLLGASAVAAAATIHILRPQTIVLAAPQTPASPAPSALSPQAEPGSPGVVALPNPAPEPVIASPSHAALPTPPIHAVVLRPIQPAVLHIDPLVAPSVSMPVLAMVADMRTKVFAMPQINVVVPDAGDARSYAIYGPGDGSTSHFTEHGWIGDVAQWDVERKKHPQGSILFKRDGKSYVIDDPALVKQAQQAYAPVEELGKQQGALGEKQGSLGEQQGELGELQGVLGEKQGEWSVKGFDVPKDFKFELPEGFNTAVNQLVESETKLAMEQDSLSASQRAAMEAQRKEAQANLDRMMAQFNAQQPQREAWAKQMQEQGEQLRKQLEPLVAQMRELGNKQGELGRLQSELGRRQSLLGREQSKASHEADRQVQSIIDQALRDGKATPVR